MKIARTISDYRSLQLENVGFVPTMGALHEGHLSLVKAAMKNGHPCVVSIFVNPTQFGPSEDFARYPRPFEHDVSLLENCGVEAIFAPETSEMYRGGATKVDVGAIGNVWEGKVRPGHFNGVATVVAKLFNIVQPHRAFFGEKDFQQCMVIEQMVDDLDLPISLHFEPTQRESDGLAMSSRNRYLTVPERLAAPELYRSLVLIRDRLVRDSTSEIVDKRIFKVEMDRLKGVGFALDYLELVEERSLSVATHGVGKLRLIVAAKLGKTRLIDNIAVHI